LDILHRINKVKDKIYSFAQRSISNFLAEMLHSAQHDTAGEGISRPFAHKEVKTLEAFPMLYG
jgi:hypothetical protein